MRNDYQAHWYRYVGEMAQGQSLLDVGAGDGSGVRLLQEAGVNAQGFEIVSFCPDVPTARIENYPSNAFCWVTAFDVIEHVQDDQGLLREMLRVAQEYVFFTTPNWLVSHATNPYHVREYTPTELEELIASFGFVRPLGAKWHDGVNDHRIYVSNNELVITAREQFDHAETWHNHGVLLEKNRRG